MTLDSSSHIRPSPFDFSCYQEFLMACAFPSGLHQQKGLNLQKWAKRLGYKSASSLTMVLKGSRFPSMELIEAFSDDLNLDEKERKYFVNLIRLKKTLKKGDDPTSILEILERDGRKDATHTLSLAEFRLMSDWYFLAIKNLISIPGFVEDAQWVSKRLRKKVNPSQVSYAISSMEELGIIQRNNENRLEVVELPLRSQKDVPVQAIRKIHQSFIEKAIDSIHEQRVEERQIQGLTHRISMSDLPEAKEYLYSFIEEFNKKFSLESGDHVDDQEIYQLNMQYFSLTKKVNIQ